MSAFCCCFRSQQNADGSVLYKNGVLELSQLLSNPSKISESLGKDIEDWTESINDYQTLEDICVHELGEAILPTLQKLKLHPEKFIGTQFSDTINKLALKKQRMDTLYRKLYNTHKTASADADHEDEMDESSIHHTTSLAGATKSEVAAGSDLKSSNDAATDNELKVYEGENSDDQSITSVVSKTWAKRLAVLDPTAGTIDIRHISTHKAIKITPKWPEFLSDTTYDVLKVGHRTGVKVRRSLRLTQHHIVSIRDGDTITKFCSYHDIRRVWLHSADTLKVLQKNNRVNVYLSQIAPHILQQISTRVQVRLSLDSSDMNVQASKSEYSPLVTLDIIKLISEENGNDSEEVFHSFATELKEKAIHSMSSSSRPSSMYGSQMVEDSSSSAAAVSAQAVEALSSIEENSEYNSDDTSQSVKESKVKHSEATSASEFVVGNVDVKPAAGTEDGAIEQQKEKGEEKGRPVSEMTTWAESVLAATARGEKSVNGDEDCDENEEGEDRGRYKRKSKEDENTRNEGEGGKALPTSSLSSLSPPPRQAADDNSDSVSNPLQQQLQQKEQRQQQEEEENDDGDDRPRTRTSSSMSVGSASPGRTSLLSPGGGGKHPKLSNFSENTPEFAVQSAIRHIIFDESTSEGNTRKIFIDKFDANASSDVDASSKLTDIRHFVDGMHDYMFSNRGISLALQYEREKQKSMIKHNSITDAMDGGGVRGASKGKLTAGTDRSSRTFVKRTSLSFLKNNMDLSQIDDGVLVFISYTIFIAVEEALFLPIKDKVISLLPCNRSDMDEDVTVVQKMKAFSKRTQAQWGIPDELASSLGWQTAIFELKGLERNLTPSAQLMVLTRSCKAIFNEFKLAVRPKLVEKGKTDVYIGADDLVPIFLFVFCQSNLKHPVRSRDLMWALCHPDQLHGESGYYLTVFESAVEFVSQEPLNNPAFILRESLAANAAPPPLGLAHNPLHKFHAFDTEMDSRRLVGSTRVSAIDRMKLKLGIKKADRQAAVEQGTDKDYAMRESFY